jgi:uncharacterized protein (DUF1697 family)
MNSPPGQHVRGELVAATERYAALLRGVSPMNCKMPALTRCLEEAGFTYVKTVLSSGNAVFNTSRVSEATLQRRIQQSMQKVLGRTFFVLLRPVSELQRILDSDPYASFKLQAGSKRVVTFLPEKAGSRLKLPIELDGARILEASGREVFSAYVPSPRGPVFMQLIEKTFGQDVTTRTWETVQKVARA